MKIGDIVWLSLTNLWQRGLRSWLTIIGIVVGIAAVVAILSIGAGMQQEISAQLGGMGADIVTISPGYTRAEMGFGRPREFRQTPTATNPTLTDKDMEVIKSVSGIQLVNGVVSGRANVTYLAQSASISVQGIDPLAWREMSTIELEAGRYLTPADRDAVVVGYRVANGTFKKPLSINSQIAINGNSFKVVGILKQSGGFFGIGDYDGTILMRVDVARSILGVNSNEYSYIQAKVADVELIDEVVANMEKNLMISRRVTEETKDFTVTSPKAIQERISEVMGTMTIFLGGIAAISLLVGAIGIANTMFMSVMERTRQIGILKSLGATNLEIMELFLFESAMIGFMGGLIGIFCGFIASGVISEIGIRMMAGMGRVGASITLITPQLILFAILFSLLIGAVSGLLPARRAANLSPVEALRYE